MFTTLYTKPSSDIESEFWRMCLAEGIFLFNIVYSHRKYRGCGYKVHCIKIMSTVQKKPPIQKWLSILNLIVSTYF